LQLYEACKSFIKREDIFVIFGYNHFQVLFLKSKNNMFNVNVHCTDTDRCVEFKGEMNTKKGAGEYVALCRYK